MGYLLGAVTQDKLDNQRGVVQNEKRQGDNQPGRPGRSMRCWRTCSPKAIPITTRRSVRWPTSTPPAWPTCSSGSVDKYGPNNAVLVLAGDINAAEARPLVEKYFGAIPRGPVNNPAPADVPTLAAPQVDRDEGPRRGDAAAAPLGRSRACSTEQLAALDLGGSILGGLASSRLDKMLVRDEKIAVVGHRRALRLPADRHVQGHGDGEAGSRPGAGREAARRDRRRFHRQRPDRGRSPPRRDHAKSAAGSAGWSRSAASAARRSRWPRAKSMPATATSTRTLATYAAVTPAKIRAGDGPVADQAGASRPPRAGRLARLMRRPNGTGEEGQIGQQEDQGRSARSQAGNSASRLAGRARLSRRHHCAPVERGQAALCAARPPFR